MRVLIVKLSSLGDVVHAMPVAHDIRAARPDAAIDWVVEPAFAPLVRRVHGLGEVIECAERRWRKQWWTRETRRQWRSFRACISPTPGFDAVIDLQGLTKSAIVARLAQGPSFGVALRTDGAGFEWPARWLVDRVIEVPRHIHAVDKSRLLAARALGYDVQGPPVYALQTHAPARGRAIVFVHGTSREDKLWPESHWIAIGRRAIADGWRIALPQASSPELQRARRIADALGSEACDVWPAMVLDAVVDRLGGAGGVIGVDSGLSHIAVALNLPHVQLYNFPTAWRTGPQRSHGHLHQTSIEGAPTPDPETVWQAWLQVCHAAD